MGPGFEESHAVTVIFALAFSVYLPMSPGVQLLYGLSKHGPYAALNAAGGVLNLILSALFIKRFGMYGAALGTAAEILLVRLTVQPRYICSAAGVSVREYLLDAILGTALKSAVLLCGFYWLIRGFILPEYFRLTACVALQTLFFAPAAYFLILSRGERRYVADLIRARARA
jgi:O-antigen/teichoic acid export membrane protein